MQLFVTQMAHCRASVLIHFNLVVVLFVCDRKFLSIKNRPAGVEQHGGLARLGCRNTEIASMVFSPQPDNIRPAGKITINTLKSNRDDPGHSELIPLTKSRKVYNNYQTIRLINFFPHLFW